jgi:hypothetical protein
MNMMTDTPELPVTPNATLPGGGRAIGIIGLVGGLWNMLCTPMLMLIIPKGDSSYIGMLATKPVLGIWFMVCTLGVIASVGLLRQRLWGYRMTLTSIVLVAGSLIAWIIHIHVAVRPPVQAYLVSWVIVLGPTFFVAMLVVATASTLLKYLKRDEIKQAFH